MPVRRKSLPETSGVTARAQRLARLHADLDAAFENRDESAVHREAWSRAAKRFKEACAEFYDPYPDVVRGIRDGDPHAMAEGLLFLAADPWCHRSGYLKADLMDAFANTQVPPDLVETLQDVVVRRVTDPEPRLLRHAARLASNVWNDELGGRLDHLTRSYDAGLAQRAQAVIEASRQRKKSISRRPAP